ncbi:hypothetical protein [Bacillus thuringiensis]|uniref:hypothetical protein n=1 Tax=Bacillus thuringiensis TaxID=1428 RepID=UPI000BFDDBA7|nr:hypothetical protein [Bacillus thuringiensis]PGT89981.1 hypothetical protein COD17_09535 [Bacillus thuringiensis]
MHIGVITLYGKEIEAEMYGTTIRIQSIHDLPKEKLIGESVAVQVKADVSLVRPYKQGTVILKTTAEVHGGTLQFSEVMRKEVYEEKKPKEITARVDVVVTAYNKVTDSFTVNVNRKQFDVSVEAVKVLYVKGCTVRIG